MPQLSEKQLILAIAAGGLLIAGASFGGVYWVSGLIEEEQTQIQDIQNKVRAAEVKKARIPKDETQVIILRQNVGEYAKILPARRELTDFARTIQSFASSSGVEIRALNLANPGASGAFHSVTYKIALRGTLWQFMRFMNSFESYKRFVQVSDFAVTAGRPELEDEQAVHDVQMVVKTYVYNPGSGGEPVKIHNYERKREQLREEIFAARADIRLESYAFKGHRLRRDIFVDPRVPKLVGGDATAGEGNWPPPKQLELVLDLAAEVQRLTTQWNEAQATPIILVRIEMQEALKKGMTELKTRIDKVEDLGCISFRPYKTKLSREVLEPFAALQNQLNKPEQGPQQGIPLEELVGFQEEIERYLMEGRLQDAKTRFQVYQGKLDFKPSDKRYEVARILKDLHKKTTTALEFTQIDLQVSGVILQESGLSAAIINGKTYQEGDPVGEQLFLKAIGPELIEFLYKGVVIAQRR